jgi:molybdate/tungstate transport system substrate-binding protein
MTQRNQLTGLLCGAALALLGGVAQAAPTVHLTIFAAGSLTRPFQQLDALFEKMYPNVVVQPQFGGSVEMVRHITDLHETADVVAVADYTVIPKYLFAGDGNTGYTNWYAGFARNELTFVYTKDSKYASQITPQNWYKILSRPGVEIGHSNPNTDPAGYATLQMLKLAEAYYKSPGLEAKILDNAPKANTRNAEVSLIGALQTGQIDYLAIYRSSAIQHHFEYIPMPAEINLSEPADAALYKTAVVDTKNGPLAGKPIVYGVTIPSNAQEAGWAAKYVALLLGPEGQKIMKENGFGTMAPAIAENQAAMPASLQPLVKPWPGS